ncbi:hypothetical protein B0T10DRAFT_21412 [Thelonectria olida]|uniref:Uncharacterized protein n=1 Tax=Thelonectria olida TaxID=1576542 RepID=A0A9P8WJ31_9HYPO|nr:hypothetical protein B0T10DRAFT_21412 [Thelonectria olida]
MATDLSVIQADKITKKDFHRLLGQYPDVIKSISNAKGAKDGQRTLQELDDYRYGEAVNMFAGGDPERSMDLDHVKTLVEWKLRHGKFRPTLMKLVSANEPKTAADIIKTALGVYRQEYDAQAALDILTNLKGIGPATASLLLTVHDPTRVIFFSDEAFYWLCSDGKKSPIKYNAKEYKLLCANAHDLSKRLDVSATDVEKVAYVLIKQQPEESKPSKKSAPAKNKKASSKMDKKPAKAASSKRKPTQPEPDHADHVASEPTTLRRSKRRRA